MLKSLGAKMLKYGGAFFLAMLLMNEICYFYYSPAIQVPNQKSTQPSECRLVTITYLEQKVMDLLL